MAAGVGRAQVPGVEVATVATAALPGAPQPAHALIGREPELAALAGLLADPDTRLLTLTGPPGVGKTRLAVAMATAAAGDFGDGARFVDVTGVDDPTAVIAEVARVLGVGDAPGLPLRDRLIAALTHKELLLVVDNCEHLLPAGTELAALAAGCPGLRIVATSRERFRVTAEQEFAVPPLAMPDRADLADLSRLAANASVALLLERTRAVLPQFMITNGNAAAIADVCVRLDGLPLALELAAARLKLFAPAELGTRLGQRMNLLTGGARDLPQRHQTLRAAIGWSHDLLGRQQRLLFRRLSVFARSWTLEAAEQVCGEPGLDVLETTASLVDKSLLQRIDDPDQVARFSMLESLREYAAERLIAADEQVVTRSRHAAYFAGLATGAEIGIGMADETRWWDWIGRERGNLRAALNHALAVGDIAAAQRVGTALGWYWYTRGYCGEGHAELDRLLQAADQAAMPVPDEVASGIFLVGGVLAWGRSDLDGAETLLHRSLTTSAVTADARHTAIASAFLGHIARTRGQHDDALAWYLRADACYRQLHNPRGSAWIRHDLGLLARDRGDLPEAESLLRAALDSFRSIGYRWAVASTTWALATVLQRAGRPADAAPLLIEALDGYQTLDDRHGIAQCLECMAGLAAGRGTYEPAARLLGAADALRLALAAPLLEPEHQALDPLRMIMQTELRPDAYDHARQSGRTMPVTAVIALATDIGTGIAATRSNEALLTRREREVTSLVATGRTNRQIGRALGIAEKTIEVHLHNIMNKLGAQGRAEVAAWAVARGLHDPGLPTSPEVITSSPTK